MRRFALALALAASFILPRVVLAQDGGPLVPDDGPPISITSPDAGTTFAYGTIKSHSLFWNKAQKVLIARVVFTDAELNNGSANDDYHEFRFPGVTFDEAKGIFYATTAKGEVIPVAHFKKTFFAKSIVTLPNAAVRILHPRGVLTAILEAISPNDPAMHPPSGNSNSDATHQVDIDKILN